MNDPIAYTYEADTHCPDCAEARFGRDDSGDIGVDSTDNEGNGVGVIAPWDEVDPEVGITCGTCGREVVEREAKQTICDMLEDPPEGCEHVADLYSWSLNYDPGKGPMTLYLDLIGWTNDQEMEPLYTLTGSRLGFIELGKLGLAINEYAAAPVDVYDFVCKLIDAETD